MKRITALLVLFIFFSGCSNADGSMDRALSLRKNLCDCEQCAFTVQIVADYSEYIYEFSLDCQVDSSGNIAFCVIKPDSISGIRGVLSARGGGLTFDDKVLVFPMIADGLISPVSAPWVLMHALTGGYINGIAELNDGLELQIDDIFENECVRVIVTMDSTGLPVSGEIYWEGSRMITMIVENFRIM